MSKFNFNPPRWFTQKQTYQMTKGKTDGNRKSHQALHGSTDQSTDQGNAGAQAGSSIAFAAVTGASVSGAFTVAPVASDRAAINRAHNASVSHEGIRAGEVIAYRAWQINPHFGAARIKPGTDAQRLLSDMSSLLGALRIGMEGYDYLEPPYLSSLTTDSVWWPGEVMEGDVSQYGVYSCKEVTRELASFLTMAPVAIGTVELWGEIVEYEQGYRSQFAKIRSIEVVNNGKADDLREKYGVAGVKEPEFASHLKRALEFWNMPSDLSF